MGATILKLVSGVMILLLSAVLFLIYSVSKESVIPTLALGLLGVCLAALWFGTDLIAKQWFDSGWVRSGFTLLTMSCLFAAHDFVIQSTTNPALSSFLSTGSSCTSIAHSIPSLSVRTFGQTAENLCYLNRMKKELSKLPAKDRASYLLRTAELFQHENRLDAASLSLLAANANYFRSQERRNAENDEAKIAATYSLVSDLVALLEIFPKPDFNSKFSAEARLIFDAQNSLAQRTVASLIHECKLSALKLEAHQQLRAPSSIPRYDSTLAGYQRKIETLKQRWQIVDDELPTQAAQPEKSSEITVEEIDEDETFY